MPKQRGNLPPEAEAGRKVILGFMDLGVNDMKYCLDAMHRVYERARKTHDELMATELRRLGNEEAKAAGAYMDTLAEGDAVLARVEAAA